MEDGNGKQTEREPGRSRRDGSHSRTGRRRAAAAAWLLRAAGGVGALRQPRPPRDDGAAAAPRRDPGLPHGRRRLRKALWTADRPSSRRRLRRRLPSSSSSSSSFSFASASSCIQFWHLSVEPAEPDTCTNSGHYPPEWAHAATLDYMFHVSAAECCEELRRPWADWAAGGGGAPACAIVDACPERGEEGEGGDAMSALSSDVGGRTPGGGDDDRPCGGTSKKRCAKMPHCRYDSGLDACAAWSPTDETSSDSAAVACEGRAKKPCVKDDACEFDAAANTCRGSMIVLAAGNGNGNDDNNNSDDNSDNNNNHNNSNNNNNSNNSNNNAVGCAPKPYHPVSMVERRCTNDDDGVPAAWRDEPAKYFFAEGAACCAAFYADGPCAATDACAAAWDAACCCGLNKKRCAKEDRCAPDAAGACAGRAAPDAGPGPASPASPATAPAAAAPRPDGADGTGGVASAAPATPPPSAAPSTPLPTSGAPTTSPTYLPSTGTPTDSPTADAPTTAPATPPPARLAHDGSALDPACLARTWHLSRVPGPGRYATCTNAARYPAAWDHPAMRVHFLFATAAACCATHFGAPECPRHDACAEGTAPLTETPSTAWPTPHPWPTFLPTVAPPETTPGAMCEDPWHASAVAERTCTNDRDFPQSWSAPARREFFLYDSAQECCEGLFPDEKCALVNVCPVGGPTMEPTELATKKPTPMPTNKVIARPTIDASWFVDPKSGQCVQDCVGPMPCGGKRTEWNDEFGTSQACCRSMSWKTFEACRATPDPTVAPTKRPTRRPTQMPTRHPTASPTTAKPTKAPIPATSVPTKDCSALKWHMSTRMGDIKTCSNSGEFPAAWLDNAPFFLHATSEICCQETFGGDPSCGVDDRCAELNQVAQDEADRAAARKEIEEHNVGGDTQGGGSSNDCSALKWHMSTRTGDVKTCSNSENFPAAWLDNAPFFLHATSEICCQKTFGGDPSCRVDDRCAELNQAAQDEADPAAAEKAICSALKWHLVPTKDLTCSNSEDFPAAWLVNPHFFLHATGELCCQKMFDSGQECEIIDVCTDTDEGNLGGEGNQGSDPKTPTVLATAGEDDFEDGGIFPWVLGNPPEWEIDENVAYTGATSMTNIPSLVAGAAQSLTLHINLPAASSLSCKLKVDISMPFDRFSLVVNGVVRNNYIGRKDDWVTLTTGIDMGENTIEFTVVNSDVLAPFDRLTQARFGTGRVWVDACSLRTN